MLCIAVLGGIRLAQTLIRTPSTWGPLTDQNALGDFPSRLGSYTLSRAWNEYLPNGPLIFHWADYAPAHEGPHVAIGLSPVMGSHDTLICHSARGEDPLWHGQLQAVTADSTIAFSGSFFNSGVSQYLEASTLCNASRCGESSTGFLRMGFIYSRPDPSALIAHDPERPIPILVRAEMPDSSLVADLAREQLSAAVQSFLRSVSLAALTNRTVAPDNLLRRPLTGDLRERGRPFGVGPNLTYDRLSPLKLASQSDRMLPTVFPANHKGHSRCVFHSWASSSCWPRVLRPRNPMPYLPGRMERRRRW